MKKTIIAGCLLAALAGAQPRFRIQDLPSPGPGINNVVYVGPNGEMNGSLSNGTPVRTTQCYKYRDGQFQFLPTPGFQCGVLSANASGDFAGTLNSDVRSSSTGDPNFVPWMIGYVNINGQYTPLLPKVEAPLQVTESYVQAINSKGEVAGRYNWFDRTKGGMNATGFVYSNGQYRLLPDIGGGHTTPRAMNDLGDVVAEADTVRFDAPSERDPATRTRREAAILYTHDGKVIDLGSLGGTNTSPQAMNNKGQVVGTATVPGAVPPIVTYLGWYYTGSVMMPVTFPGAQQVGLNSINDAGDAVGSIFWKGDANKDEVRAIFHRGGRSWDLNTLVENLPADTVLTYAREIQEDGSIIVNSEVGNNRAARTHLLVPVDGAQSEDSDGRRDARRR